MVESTRIEIVGKEGWEAEGLVILGNEWFRCVRGFAAALGQRGFFVVVIRNIMSNGGGITTGRFVELGGGLQVRLLDRTGHSSGSGLVDAERELHALDGARSTVDAGLAAPFLLSSAQLNHIGGMVPFESGSFEFNNAPA